MEDKEQEFVFQLIDWQVRLLSYLVTLLGDIHDARDVLQETNVVLLRKAGEIEDGTDVGAWFRRFAHFQALAFLRDRKRDRHLFDDDILDLFACDQFADAPDENRLLALRECLKRLPADRRNLIEQRYSVGKSVRQLAQEAGRRESGTKMLLMRIREALRSCIESQLRETHR